MLYTRYPIVARALGLAAARPSASREQRYLAYNFPWSYFKKLGTPDLSSSSSTSTALSPKNFEKRAHPTVETIRRIIINHGCKNRSSLLSKSLSNKVQVNWNGPGSYLYY